MKCSLLVLSTYIDGELSREAHAEVDAHIVGCSRCATGATTLREEKLRVARLAQVRVPSDSARAMLEQVGILVAAEDAEPSAPAVRVHHPGDDASWAAPSVPWATPHPARIEVEEALPSQGNEDITVQRELAATAIPTPIETAALHPGPATAEELGVAAASPDIAAGAGGGAGVWPTAASAQPVPRDSWEERPARGESSPAHPPSVPAPVQFAPPPPPPAPPPAFEAPAPAPIRAPAAGGATALWSRVRDALAVRLALTRGSGADADDSMHVVTGAPVRPESAATSQPSMDASTSAIAPPAPPEAASADLTGRPWPLEARPHPVVGARTGDVASTAPASAAVDASRHPALAHDGILPAAAAPILAGAIDLGTYPQRGPDPAAPPSQPPAGTAAAASGPADDDWHAFAASSYAEPAAESAAPHRDRPLGRHGRAVLRDGRGLGERAVASVAAAAASLRLQVNRRAGSRSTAAPRLNPDSRLWAAVAAVGLVFVLALLIGHVTAPASPRHAATAAHASGAPSVAPSAAATQPATPAPTSTAAPSTPAPAATAAYGTGATGFSVDGLRYGKTATYTRIVFDLGGPSGATGTPRITIATETPTTLLVTLYGTAPSGLTGTPPGPLLTSVSLVSSGSSQATYRLTLSRPSRQVAFFLLSPVRFVLDLH